MTLKVGDRVQYKGEGPVLEITYMTHHQQRKEGEGAALVKYPDGKVTAILCSSLQPVYEGPDRILELFS